MAPTTSKISLFTPTKFEIYCALRPGKYVFHRHSQTIYNIFTMLFFPITYFNKFSNIFQTYLNFATGGMAPVLPRSAGANGKFRFSPVKLIFVFERAHSRFNGCAPIGTTTITITATAAMHFRSHP